MAETDINLKVGLENKDVVQKSKELQNEIQRTFNKIDTSKLDAKTKASMNQLNKLSQKATEIQKNMEKLAQAEAMAYSKLEEQAKIALDNFEKAKKAQAEVQANPEATVQELADAQHEVVEWQKVVDQISSTMGEMQGLVPTEEYSALNEKLGELNEEYTKALEKFIKVFFFDTYTGICNAYGEDTLIIIRIVFGIWAFG